MADIVTMAKDELKARGKADAAVLAARAVSGEADATELTASQEQIPTWRQRDFSADPVGSPYKWNGIVYKLWQQHDATEQPDWSPDQAVSMWDVCHTTDPVKAKPYTAPQGSRGMWQEGECCVEQEPVRRCKKDSTVYPPSQLPGRIWGARRTCRRWPSNGPDQPCGSGYVSGGHIGRHLWGYSGVQPANQLPH